MRTATAPLAALLIVIVGLAHPAAHAAVFRTLPDLPGGDTGSVAWGLSRDGSTVVGSSYDAGGLIAAYWNTTGVHAIDTDPSGARPFAAFAASGDGGTIVGGIAPGVRAFAWKAAPGGDGFRTHRLPELAGATFLNSRAQDVDDSGRYVVGYSHTPESRPGNLRIQAVTWDTQTASPAARGLGYLDPAALPSSNAVSISGDGATIVGDARGIGTIVPFSVPRQGGAMTPLDVAVASTTDAIAAANFDGTVVVGRLAGHGFVWTGEVSLLEALGDNWTAGALAVSDNGSVVVGSAQTLTFDESAAVVWDVDGRVRRLDDMLTTDWHIDLTGWQLTSATGVSGDGQTIAGYGINPAGQQQGFVVTIPAPSVATVAVLSLITGAMLRRRKAR
jgi:uncharacterized membrane protein